MICFVVLHYCAIETTIACIESIKKNVENNNCRIIVVDNHSPDQSGVELEKKYKDDDVVEVLQTEDNLGFAKGNNIGYRHAKERWNPKFIVILNNDTLLTQSDFLEKVDRIYTDTGFDVLGPDIISGRTGDHQNPAHLHPLKKEK